MQERLKNPLLPESQMVFPSDTDMNFRVRWCQTTDRDSCREPGRRGMFHAGTLRRWNVPCHPNWGHDFPDLVAKNGEFRYMVFGIRNNLCLFARTRYKMTSKMIANGRFWMGDLRPDRAVLLRKGKNPCFGGSQVGSFDRNCLEKNAKVLFEYNLAIMDGITGVPGLEVSIEGLI